MAGDEAVASHVSSVDDDAPGNDKNEGLTVSAEGAVVDHGLHRELKQRHLQMIALGGVIGYAVLAVTATLSKSSLCFCYANKSIQCKHLVWHWCRDIVFRSGKELADWNGSHLHVSDRCTSFFHDYRYRRLLRNAKSRGDEHALSDYRRIHRTGGPLH